MSLLNSLLSKLTDRQREREQTAVETYRDTVRSIAAGDEPDAEAVEAVLRDTGKTANELVGDVELLQRRQRWRETLVGEADLKRERSQLLTQKETAKTEFKRLETEYRQSVADLDEQLSRLDGDLRECDEARRLLGTTAPAQLQAAQDTC